MPNYSQRISFFSLKENLFMMKLLYYFYFNFRSSLVVCNFFFHLTGQEHDHKH